MRWRLAGLACVADVGAASQSFAGGAHASYSCAALPSCEVPGEAHQELVALCRSLRDSCGRALTSDGAVATYDALVTAVAANATDVEVAAGATIVFDAAVAVRGALAVRGRGGATLDGASSTRLFVVTGRLALRDVALRGGFADGAGGAISVSGAAASATLVRVFAERNFAARDGGGVVAALAGSTLRLANCTFSNNSAPEGGVVAAIGDAMVVATNCSFVKNTAWGNGGAVYTETSAPAFLRDCLFEHNAAEHGAGVYFAEVGYDSYVYETYVYGYGDGRRLDETYGGYDETYNGYGEEEEGSDDGWDCTDAPESIFVGDGYCDSKNNVDPCYDGGDCCESTCVTGDYDCGAVGYDCEDPSADDYGDESVYVYGYMYSYEERMASLRGGVLDLTGSVARSNAATETGGFLHVDGDLDALVGGVYEGNSAPRGGVAYVASGAVRAEGLRVVGNEATTGAVFFVAAAAGLDLFDVASANNAAKASGALVYASPQAEVSLSNVTSAVDAAGQYGIVKLEVGAAAALEDVTFSGASVATGVVWASATASLDLRRVVIDGATGDDSGAALFLDAADAVASDVVVRGVRGGEEGAIYLYEAALYARHLVAEDNVAARAGVLFLDRGGYAELDDSVLRRNSAAVLEGGAVFLQRFGTLWSNNSQFVNNTANVDAGAVCLFGYSVAGFHNATFSGNAALRNGGAVHAMTWSVFLATNATFAGNEALYGDGGAFHLSHGPFVNVSGGVAAGNAARFGGGGVAFYDWRDTAAPDLSRLADGGANAADYGDFTATAVASLRASHAGFQESASEAFGAPVAFDALDALGQVVTTVDRDPSTLGFASTSQAVLFSWDATLLGSNRLDFDRGVAATTDLAAAARPGATVAVAAFVAIDDDVFEASVDVPLRACVPGEYDDASANACVACPAGTYSFATTEPCRGCPDHATCDGGASMAADDGWWRSAYDSDEVRKCRFEDACDGHVDLWADVDAPLGADAQCAGDHTGPMCALCAGDRQLDASTGHCVPCRRAEGAQGLVAIAVAVVAVAAMLLGLRAFARRSYDAVLEAGDRALVRFNDAKAILKILVVFYQIVGGAPRSFPTVDFPRALAGLADAVRFLDFDVTAFLASTCLFGSADYLDTLKVMTAGPVALLLALQAYKKAASYVKPDESDALEQRWGGWQLLVSFLVYGTSSYVVIRALVCDGDFTASPASEFYRETFLFEDYSVSCDTARYRAHATYAVAMVFVYPIGIPLSYLVLLIAQKHNIAPRDVRALARAVVERSKEADVDGALDREKARFDADYAAAPEKDDLFASRPSTDALATARARRLAADKVERATLAVVRRDCALAYLRAGGRGLARTTSDLGSGASEATEARLGDRLVSVHRDLEPACLEIAFLYEEYDPQFWYFEILECVRRLLLTALLPLPQSAVAHDSIAHGAAACFIAACFAGLYANLRPFASDTLDTYANVMQAVLLLNLFAILLMDADQHACDARDRTGVDANYYGWILFAVDTVAAIGAAIYTFLEITFHDELQEAALDALATARRRIVSSSFFSSSSSSSFSSSSSGAAPPATLPSADTIVAGVVDSTVAKKKRRESHRPHHGRRSRSQLELAEAWRSSLHLPHKATAMTFDSGLATDEASHDAPRLASPTRESQKTEILCWDDSRSHTNPDAPPQNGLFFGFACET